MKKYAFCLSEKMSAENTLKEFAEFSRRLGWDGLIVLGDGSEDISKSAGIEIVSGVFLNPSNESELRKSLSKCRKTVEIIVAKCDFRCLDDRVDIVVPENPTQTDIRMMKNKSIFFALNFRELFLSSGIKRVSVIKRMSDIAGVCSKENAVMLPVSPALSLRDVRGPSILSAFACALGSDKGEVNSSFKSLDERIERNRKRLSGGFVMKGVRKI